MNDTTTTIVTSHIHQIGAIEEKARNQDEKIINLEKKLEKNDEECREAKADCAQQISDLKEFIKKQNFKMKVFILLAASGVVAGIAGADSAINLAEMLAVFL